jgi:hypothetical protein
LENPTIDSLKEALAFFSFQRIDIRNQAKEIRKAETGESNLRLLYPTKP